MIGGLLVYFSKSSARRVALINIFVTTLTMPPFLAFMVRCPVLNVAGITQPFNKDR